MLLITTRKKSLDVKTKGNFMFIDDLILKNIHENKWCVFIVISHYIRFSFFEKNFKKFKSRLLFFKKECFYIQIVLNLIKLATFILTFNKLKIKEEKFSL